MNNKINKANLRKYSGVILGLRDSLLNLSGYMDAHIVTVTSQGNSTTLPDNYVDKLLKEIDKYIAVYGQDDSVGDDFMIPSINSIMTAYREITAPFIITVTGIVPREGTVAVTYPCA